jgi:hypothetical protein
MLVSKTYRNICLYVFGTQKVMIKVTINRKKTQLPSYKQRTLNYQKLHKNLFVNTKFSSLRSKHSQKAYHTHKSIISPLWTQGVCGTCTGLTCQWGRSRMVDFFTRATISESYAATGAMRWGLGSAWQGQRSFSGGGGILRPSWHGPMWLVLMVCQCKAPAVTEVTTDCTQLSSFVPFQAARIFSKANMCPKSLIMLRVFYIENRCEASRLCGIVTHE